MRKRLRKKLRKGEFDCPLLPITFRMVHMGINERNAFLDAFLSEAIEANGIQFGGGGTSDVWSGFAEPGGKLLTVSAEQRRMVQEWLSSRIEIQEFYVGEVLRDSEVLQIQEEEQNFPESHLHTG